MRCSIDSILICGGLLAALAGCGGSHEQLTRTPPTHNPSNPARPADATDTGWITLFDGTTAAGWVIDREDDQPPDPNDFFIQDGMICCKGLGYHWFRYDAREFGDFILQMEFKVEKGANSGVCLRSARQGAPPFTGFEVQILDDHGQPPNKNSCGSIYDVVTPMFNASRPAGEWNQLEITCQGSIVRVELNGLKVIDTDFARLTAPIGKFPRPYAELPRSGYITLQDHWKPVAFYRNIRIKPL